VSNHDQAQQKDGNLKCSSRVAPFEQTAESRYFQEVEGLAGVFAIDEHYSYDRFKPNLRQVQAKPGR
jgi:hypothetical protein